MLIQCIINQFRGMIMVTMRDVEVVAVNQMRDITKAAYRHRHMGSYRTPPIYQFSLCRFYLYQKIQPKEKDDCFFFYISAVIL
jgi:hypothetical protein